MSLWTEFLRALREPEYVHVLLNPLPVYGLAAGLFALLAAALARSHAAKALALLLIFVAALTVWPAAHFGEAGYDRVTSMSNGVAQKWLNWHMHLADKLVWVDTAAAAVALLALLALWKAPRFQRAALILTALVALGGLGLGGLVGYAGGKIRHSEFRSQPPPAWANTAGDAD
ncbi:hypothetical protein K0B96_03280 [Horticoccus luteus]|uniref:DUF2231 domain-containing protein n=1 Tax=Horticoccus luteus TaxID=2862869 RepID=A0A8F9TWY6_9BACT|nr:hypothetical protein [Horticoccus luteus]QYM79655.1 hypothetical protein K0B96_03280 [Horticoccus luteus]